MFERKAALRPNLGRRLPAASRSVAGSRSFAVTTTDYSNDSSVTRCAMGSHFVGRYKLVSSENFEEYMKVLGVNPFLRKIGNLAVPIIEFTIDDGLWTIRSYTVFKNLALSFRLNEEFVEVTPDGRQVLTIFTLEDDKLVQRQKATKKHEKDSVIVREVREEKMFVVRRLLSDNKFYAVPTIGNNLRKSSM
ncbi:unnamed protein product [Soboliphyme baturini]|uniref:FABP domain-containing protein n=1 Tax=Soboliphyme baturini TaxID=241478 RepID=A0A183IG96_9BILA|nr:unnamed protein product [Soboliphyme baturini]